MIGIAVEIFAPYSDPKGVLDGISHASGQPVTYALIFAVFVSVLATDANARSRLLIAWCAGALVESLIVAAQFKSGAAYDPVIAMFEATVAMERIFSAPLAS